MDESAAQHELFVRLLETAARTAEQMLAAPEPAVRLRTLAEDGLNEIERLELSPFAEDQLVAVALRLAEGAAFPGRVQTALTDHFENAPSSFALEAQRRSVWSGQTELPNDLAAEAVDALEMQLSACVDLSSTLHTYAALYADLWCDPRLGAALPARRIMLAMVTALRAREDALRGRAHAIARAARCRNQRW